MMRRWIEGLRASPHRWRALLGWLALALLLVVFTIGQSLLVGYDLPQFLLHAIFNLYALLIILVLVVIVRSTVKLLHEEKRRVRGGLKRRMLVYFSACAMPLTVLLLLSLSEAVYFGVQNWFDPRTDAFVAAADHVAKRYRELAIDGQVEDTPEMSGLVSSLEARVAAYEREKAVHVPVRKNYLLILLLSAVLVVFGTIWVVAYLARELTVPIRQLAEGAERIALGELDFELDVDARDEIADLVQSFREMQRRLRDNRQALERAAEELEEQNQRLHTERVFISTVLAEASAAVIAIDHRGVVMAINKATLPIFGGTSREYLGRSFEEALSAGHLRPILRLVKSAWEHRVALRESEVALGQGGRPLIVSLSVRPMFEPAPAAAFLGLVLVVEDLTELLEAQKVAAWREVARRVAHEIKNPLTPIKLSAERLRRRRDEASGRFAGLLADCTDTILSEVEGMKRLVDEFSQFARLPEARLRPGRLNPIVEAVARPYRNAPGAVEIQVELAEDLPLVDIDEDQIRQVLTNLLDNALRAVGEGGRIVLRTRWDRRLGIACLEVEDTGPGIPPALRDKSFLPDFSTKKEGGLGLAIVRRIVTDHRGYVRVREGAGGVGARFIVELPVPRRIQRQAWPASDNLAVDAARPQST